MEQGIEGIRGDIPMHGNSHDLMPTVFLFSRVDTAVPAHAPPQDLSKL
jgi:hypothetical protein